MSKIYVTGIIGVGIYAVPSSDAALATAEAGMDSLLSVPGIPLFVYASRDFQAFVRDIDGVRTLNCLIEGFTYNGTTVPSEAATDQMLAAIELALKSVPAEPAGVITAMGELVMNGFGEILIDP
jgi:hypothetical protein